MGSIKTGAGNLPAATSLHAETYPNKIAMAKRYSCKPNAKGLKDPTESEDELANPNTMHLESQCHYHSCLEWG